MITLNGFYYTWKNDIVVDGNESWGLSIDCENVSEKSGSVHQDKTICLEDVPVGAADGHVGEGLGVVQLAKVGCQILGVQAQSSLVDDGRTRYYSRGHSVSLEQIVKVTIFFLNL